MGCVESDFESEFPFDYSNEIDFWKIGTTEQHEIGTCTSSNNSVLEMQNTEDKEELNEILGKNNKFNVWNCNGQHSVFT